MSAVTYYGKRSERTGFYDYIVAIADQGCFITDPIEEWVKDNDYEEEALSNSVLYEKLSENKAHLILERWGRPSFTHYTDYAHSED